MQRTLLILNLIFLLALSGIAQNHRVTRIFKQTDTCLALQVINQTLPVSLSKSDFLYLMDDFKCIKAEMITLKPYQNKIYLPNGAHSNVSVVSFEANEQLTLHNNNSGGKSITWLSIPRHLRNNPDGTTNTPVVFAENNFSNGYDSLFLEYDNINPEFHTDNLVHAYGNINNSWSWDNPIMETINSTRGYKLEIYPNGPNKLTITGTLENQNTGITLIGPENENWPENWVGYWLYQEQSPFDAIEPNQLDDLAIIKAQDWYCYRDETPVGSGQAPWICALNIGINAPRLKYGDMVILKSYNDISDFHWQNGTTPSPSEVKSATVHYQYEEQADYTAYLIEIDTANRPQEIGAFIGDSCIGATTVLPDDTLVLIRGYDKDTVGDVVFEEYYSTKSSVPAITDYFVKIPGKQLWQKRTINNKEGKSHYLISFKRKKTVSPINDDNDFALKVYPNPAQNRLTVEYTTSGEVNTTLEVFDVTGKKIVKLQNRLTAGIHQNVINTQHFINGIYLLRVSTGNQTAVKRFVVNK